MNENLIKIREAYYHHNGKWPIELTSGVMFWRGLRVTIKDFKEYREMIG